MARNRDGKAIQGGSSGQPEDSVIQTPSGVGSPIPKVQPLPTEEQLKGAPKKIFYEVLNGGYINMPGQGKTAVRAGKQVNNLDFNLDNLEAQGIKLRRITPEDPPPQEPAKPE